MFGSIINFLDKPSVEATSFQTMICYELLKGFWKELAHIKVFID